VNWNSAIDWDQVIRPIAVSTGRRTSESVKNLSLRAFEYYNEVLAPWAYDISIHLYARGNIFLHDTFVPFCSHTASTSYDFILQTSFVSFEYLQNRWENMSEETYRKFISSAVALFVSVAVLIFMSTFKITVALRKKSAARVDCGVQANSETDVEECSICYENLGCAQCITVLECNHAFHASNYFLKVKIENSHISQNSSTCLQHFSIVLQNVSIEFVIKQLICRTKNHLQIASGRPFERTEAHAHYAELR